MKVYLIAAAALLTFAVLSEITFFRGKKLFQHIFLACGSALLFFVSAFRLNTGHDYPNYTRSFMKFMGMPLAELAKERMEKGYVLINRYINIFTNDFQALFVVTTLIIIALSAVILAKYCKNPSMGLLSFYLLGFYFNSMNFLRTTIAASIILFAYKYIRDRQFLRFLVVVVLASAFHLSALLMIPLYFIMNIKINYKSLTIFCAVGGAIFLLSKDIMMYITTYVYTSYSPETSLNMFLGIPVAYSLFIALILVCAMLLRKDIKKHSDFGNILISATFFDFYFGFIGFKHAILSRFASYFGPAMALLLVPLIIRITIDKIIYKTDYTPAGRIRTYFCLLGTAAASFGFFAYALLNNYNRVVPHDWIWNLQ